MEDFIFREKMMHFDHESIPERDLRQAIEMGDHPEWELCVQMIEERNEHAFDLDILDAAKDPARIGRSADEGGQDGPQPEP